MSSGRSKKDSKSFKLRKALKLGLHERLEENDLEKLYQIFLNREHPMTQKELEDVLKEVAEISFDQKEFTHIFTKMNTKRDGLVTWDEFVSYLVLCFREQEVTLEYKSLDLPISEIPRLLKSNHRHPINRITFCATLRPDRTCSFADGSYITCSKDGMVNYWSLDMQLERTVQSTSTELKVQSTWVLDLICMTDVSVVCTSSTERDLRFYDTSARKFELRVLISSLEDGVCCMAYAFHEDINRESKLIMGDMGGSIRILLFSPVARGPFKSKPGVPLLQLRYESIIKGLAPGFRMIEFRKVHSDWVRQVTYYSSLKSVVSCSSCHRVALHLKDIAESKGSYIYPISKGCWCFAVAEAEHIIATGGPDCLVRIWNPFVPRKPNAVFAGHHAGITHMVFQDGAKKLATLSKDKCIKVWDISDQVCLQTFLGLPPELGEHTELTLLYNPQSRELIVGSVMIAIVHLCPLLSWEHTDGNTHSLGVSVALYNPLFKIILTCGLDSLIIVWDPWTGRRMSVVREAHTRLFYGETIPVEITAATFDPGYQLLLTGATNGSIKMWNFNTGTCVRNMRIEPGCEVASVIWVKGRILAAGWNRHVTEFDDGGAAAAPGGAFSKSWDTRHLEDILCAAARVPQTLATSSYKGELILWRLETGQPYKQYDVGNPHARIKIQYKPEKKVFAKFVKPPPPPPTVPQAQRRRSSLFQKPKPVVAAPPQMSMATPATRARRISIVTVPESCVPIRRLAVHCMIFLSSRPMTPGLGTLLVAIENGTIQVWSHHPISGYITSFNAIHAAGDYVISMATDLENEYLFTGTTAGYIKTWLMKNYCLLEDIHVVMPKYRLTFPFMWRDFIEGRAKRAHRGQEKPVLLNCYKAHLMAVSDITYIDDAKILLSCSADFSARLWTLGGRYLGTLGTFKPWVPLEVDTQPSEHHHYLFPPDIKRVASSTSFKVICGRNYERRLTKKQQMARAAKELKEYDLEKDVYGIRVNDPILGNHFKLPERTTGRHEFTLDTSLAYIPVYQHLIRPPPYDMISPTVPGVIKEQTMLKEEKHKNKAEQRALGQRPSLKNSNLGNRSS